MRKHTSDEHVALTPLEVPEHSVERMRCVWDEYDLIRLHFKELCQALPIHPGHKGLSARRKFNMCVCTQHDLPRLL